MTITFDDLPALARAAVPAASAPFSPELVLWEESLPGGCHWSGLLRRGTTLRLTDLTLFTEARYTRHLSQADAFSAFQDGPVALEHFPAGSLVMPNRTFPPSGFSDGSALR